MSNLEDDFIRRLRAAALEVARKKPTELSREAVAQLEAALIDAHVLRSRRSPLVDRYCANTLLRACVLLINSNPDWRELKLAAPLAQLSGALGDLNLRMGAADAAARTPGPEGHRASLAIRFDTSGACGRYC